MIRIESDIASADGSITPNVSHANSATLDRQTTTCQ